MRTPVFPRAAALASLALVLAFGCSDQKNPYRDEAKSDIALVVYDTTGAPRPHGDTVTIFNTDTFYVELRLQAHIESFRFAAEGNRHWPHGDTLINGDRFGDAWRFPFPVSFFDTGATTVRVTAWLQSGDSLTDSMTVHRRSPLSQADISAALGEQVELSTTPVADPFVLYVWKFGSDTSTISDRPIAMKQLSGAAFTTGELYVKAAGIRSLSPTARRR